MFPSGGGRGRAVLTPAWPARRGTASSSCISSSASGRRIPMSSETGSTTPLPEVKRAAVITHGRAETSGETLERLRAVAEERGIKLLLPDEEAAKHGDGESGDVSDADLAIVLGGDGT